MRPILLRLWILLLVLPFSSATAQEQLGTVAAVNPEAIGSLGAHRATLIRGSALREGETIVTGPRGEVQILFSDDTHLVIGAGSTLVIERYLMRADAGSQSFVVNALAGTFRFITGNGDKSAYAINTPTGTLGVRGTEFDFTVERATGKTTVILFEGGVSLCPRSGECVLLTDRCGVAQLTSPREANLAGKNGEASKVAGAEFPYVSSQAGLQRGFRVREASDCAVPRTAVNKQSKVATVVATPPPPPPPPPEPTPETPKQNNGLGNGGEGAEGIDETGNPGKNKKQNKKP